MQVKIFIQKNTKEDFWNRQAQKALAAEILRKRYTAVYLEALNAEELDLDTYWQAGEPRVLLYLGYSKLGTPKNLTYLIKHGIHPILINNGLANFSGSCSRVFINYRDAVEKALSYLTTNGRERIALYGINPSSPTDKIMESCFADHRLATGKDPARDIYYNYAAITNCYAQFLPHARAYDAVLCANDIVAVTLMGSLRSEGIRIPEDTFLLSCGVATLLAEQAAVPITTVSVDHDAIAKQAITAYTLLQKHTGEMTLTLRTAPQFRIRASTAFAPMPDTFSPSFPITEKTPSVNFYKDPVTQNFFHVEHLLLNCDELDLDILTGSRQGLSYSKLAEQLFSSVNMISYRVKRMCRLAKCQNKEELMALIAPYFK